MEEVLKFLQENKTFFIATCEGDQPRVRPFGAVCEFEGKIYICTNSTKNVYKQIMKNPKIEICAMDKKGGWLRIEAKAFRDDRDKARQVMLDANPSLGRMYKIGDGIYEVLYLMEATASFCSFTGAPKIVNF